MNKIEEDISFLKQICDDLRDNYNDDEWDLSEDVYCRLEQITGLEYENADWDDSKLAYFIDGMQRGVKLQKECCVSTLSEDKQLQEIKDKIHLVFYGSIFNGYSNVEVEIFDMIEKYRNEALSELNSPCKSSMYVELPNSSECYLVGDTLKGCGNPKCTDHYSPQNSHTPLGEKTLKPSESGSRITKASEDTRTGCGKSMNNSFFVSDKCGDINYSTNKVILCYECQQDRKANENRMIKNKYCPTCGRETRGGNRTTYEIMKSIKSMLKLDVWIKGKRTDMLNLEEAIKKCQLAEEKGK